MPIHRVISSIALATAVVAGAALLLFAPAANATTYDLNSDWSNTSNPNGPWALLQGNAPLPFVPGWTGINSAWAPSNNNGNFLPGWFQANETGASACGSNCDWNVGDVIMHTVDASNGNPSLGVANVQFTSPTAGVADISGVLWNARNIGRSQGWDLYVGGLLVDSGSLPGNGTITESDPTTFNLAGILLSANETVDLAIFNTGGTGDFVGNDLTINFTATPLPSTWLMLLGGLFGLGLFAYRGTKKSAAAIAAA